MSENKHKLMAGFKADANAIHKDWWVAMESFAKDIQELTGIDDMRRYAAKRDLNESEIITALRAAGATVIQSTEVDLIVGHHGVTYLMEVKGKRGRLTPSQKQIVANWQGHYSVVRTVDEALREIGVIADDPASCIELVATCFEGGGE